MKKPAVRQMCVADPGKLLRGSRFTPVRFAEFPVFCDEFFGLIAPLLLL
jgi:hypothetical protein